MLEVEGLEFGVWGVGSSAASRFCAPFQFLSLPEGRLCRAVVQSLGAGFRVSDSGHAQFDSVHLVTFSNTFFRVRDLGFEVEVLWLVV